MWELGRAQLTVETGNGFPFCRGQWAPPGAICEFQQRLEMNRFGFDEACAEGSHTCLDALDQWCPGLDQVGTILGGKLPDLFKRDLVGQRFLTDEQEFIP